MADFISTDNPIVIFPATDVDMVAVFSVISTPSPSPVPVPSPTPQPSQTPQVIPTSYRLSVKDDGNAGDSYIVYQTNSPNELGSRSVKTVDLPEGSVVTITSSAYENYRFVQLESSGVIVSTDPQSTHYVSGNANFIARYMYVPPADPTPTPTPSRPPAPTPGATPQPSTTPMPSPSPVTWRSCIDDSVNIGSAPGGWIEIFRTGAGGGTCWEPTTTVAFEPNLNSNVIFKYQRGSPEYPQPAVIRATNPSNAAAYAVSFDTNPGVVITPSAFTIAPRQVLPFTISITPELMNQLADGTSVIDMNVTIERVI